MARTHYMGGSQINLTYIILAQKNAFVKKIVAFFIICAKI